MCGNFSGCERNCQVVTILAAGHGDMGAAWGGSPVSVSCVEQGGPNLSVRGGISKFVALS